jgi:hypothetical protein
MTRHEEDLYMTNYREQLAKACKAFGERVPGGAVRFGRDGTIECHRDGYYVEFSDQWLTLPFSPNQVVGWTVGVYDKYPNMNPHIFEGHGYKNFDEALADGCKLGDDYAELKRNTNK